MIDDEFKYYKTNLQDLLKTHKGKYIVIKDQKVVGEYGDEKSAYIDASNKWELGTFLIKKCILEKEDAVKAFPNMMTTNLDAKHVFRMYISPRIIGKNSDETIKQFCSLGYSDYYEIAKANGLKERQISALIGFKDEFFVELLISQIIKEEGLSEMFRIKKVTANRTSGIEARESLTGNKMHKLMLGGDCVIYDKRNNKVAMIMECKEYIDMIRLKEVIGESRLIKDDIVGTKNLLGDVMFCVFTDVLELTDEWGTLLKNSDLKHKIGEIFVVREGKRKDKENKPNYESLLAFKLFIVKFLRSRQ